MFGSSIPVCLKTSTARCLSISLKEMPLTFCAQVLLAALDRNMHSFRSQATTKNGHLIFKKQYSKRTKHGHPEPVRAEKTYDYIQFLMASILKARVDDKESAARVISLPSDHPRNLAPTIGL